MKFVFKRVSEEKSVQGIIRFIEDSRGQYQHDVYEIHTNQGYRKTTLIDGAL